MFRFYAFVLLLLCTSPVLFANKVNGDQNIGGVHFFEFHSTSGGMGLGVKIILALLAAGLLAWYCIRRKAKKFMKKSLIGNVLTSVASPQPVSPNQPAPAQPVQPYQLVVQAPRRSHHRQHGYYSDSEVSGPARHHRRRDQSQ